MVGIEKTFIAAFRSSRKLHRFYKLLLKQNVFGTDDIRMSATKTREVIEVQENFQSSEDIYFKSYLTRTILELVVVSLFLFYLIFIGVPVIIFGDKIIICDVNEYLYACSGHPQEFYKVVLSIALTIILFYIIINIYNLAWIINPFRSQISCILNHYRQNLIRAKKIKQATQLNDIYFQNKDLRMLIDLLALNHGVGPGIAAIGLFDEDFYETICCRIVQLKSNNCSEIAVTIQKPSDLFSSAIQRSPDLRVKMVVELCSSDDNLAKVYDVIGDQANVSVTFSGLMENVEYSVKVTILVNGRSVSLIERQIGKNEDEKTHITKYGQDNTRNIKENVDILESIDNIQSISNDQPHHFKSE